MGQNLSDFRAEVRGNFVEMVRKDTYAVERDAMKERIAALEQRIISLEQRAKSAANLSYGAWISVAVAVVTLWITRGQG